MSEERELKVESRAERKRRYLEAKKGGKWNTDCAWEKDRKVP